MLQRLTLTGILLSAAAPLAGQDAGLLLGFSHAGEYRTMWITMSADSATVAAEVADLVVPSGTSFWRIGITTLCHSEGTRQVVWQAPLGRAPELPGTPCPEPLPAAPNTGSAEPLADEEDAGCDVSTATIYWVSPGWISEGYTFSQTEECEPRGGRWRDSTLVRRFDRQDPINLGDALGSQAPDVWAAAVAREHRQLSKEMKCPEATEGDFDPMNWSAQHRRGRLRGVVLANAEYGQCQLWAELAAPLPATISGKSAPKVAVDTSKVRDWLVSPRGSYLVTLTEPRPNEILLQVWTVKRGKPDGLLLERPMGSQSRVVEAEWATGRFVAEWTTVVRNARR